MRCQVFAKLAKPAPDGHTSWHSFSSVRSREEALQEAMGFLGKLLQYDQGDATMTCDLAVVQEPTSGSVACCDDMDQLACSGIEHLRVEVRR